MEAMNEGAKEDVRTWKMRIEEIEQKAEKYKALAEKTKADLVKLKNSLKKAKVEQQKEVRGQLAESFAKKEASGVIDDVYRLPIKSPELRQLEENISKLLSTVEWCTDMQRRLSQEKQDLAAKIIEHTLGTEFDKMMAAYDQLVKAYQLGEQKLEEMKQSAVRLYSLDNDWKSYISNRGHRLHVEDQFALHFVDQFKASALQHLSLASILNNVSRWRNLGHNPFSIDNTQSPDRQSTNVQPLLRDHF
jgi:hypothetical protein